jgi:hypothetical protein
MILEYNNIIESNKMSESKNNKKKVKTLKKEVFDVDIETTIDNFNKDLSLNPDKNENNEKKREVSINSKEEDTNNIIDKIHDIICKNTDDSIILLKKKEVIKWIFDDLSFLPKIEKKNKTTDNSKYKKLEDSWGKNMFKYKDPTKILNKQWTNKFGEYICIEIYSLFNKKATKPQKLNKHLPDIELDDCIIEVKTGTYYTEGTAHEKILGCPFKYADIPTIYSKPLKIFCVGGAEKKSRENYGNLSGEKCTDKKKEFIEFFKKNQIEYIGATDLLKLLITN